MPEATLTHTAPAAPAAPPRQPLPEIHVTEAGMSRTPATDRGPAPAPPRQGSATQRMFSELRKKAGVVEEAPEPEAPTKPAAAPKPTVEPKPETPEAGAPAETPPEAAPAAEPAAGETAKRGKQSPWKLVDEHKAARLKAETELAEMRKSMVDPARHKELETKAEAAEKRARELDEFIKYVDYTKSSEFQDKYQKPYEDAWQRWMTDLSELTVPDANGNDRPISPADLAELVGMPLARAKEEATTKFGDFATEVMAARKELRSLFDNQQRALSEAKQNASKRMTELQQQQQQQREQLNQEIAKLWKESNESVLTDEKVKRFFTPTDGDDDGNERLRKGYELADRAFSVNPHTPGLTPEQRAEVVRLHAAIRNRAAAFGRVAYLNQKLEAKVAELTKQLAQYKGILPGAGEPKRTESAPAHTSAMESAMDALRKIAR